MKSIHVSIKGVSPLLMHKFPLVPIEALEKKTPAEQAELAAYKSPDGSLHIPGVNIQRALVSAATFSKGKGRASLQREVAASLLVEEGTVPLGTSKYEVDSRPVRIAATKGTILRHRPRLDQWACSFTLCYEETLMTEKQVNEVVANCGSRVGLLEFRPERKGPFGRFIVTKFESSNGK